MEKPAPKTTAEELAEAARVWDEESNRALRQYSREGVFDWLFPDKSWTRRQKSGDRERDEREYRDEVRAWFERLPDGTYVTMDCKRVRVSSQSPVNMRFDIKGGYEEQNLLDLVRWITYDQIEQLGAKVRSNGTSSNRHICVPSTTGETVIDLHFEEYMLDSAGGIEPLSEAHAGRMPYGSRPE